MTKLILKLLVICAGQAVMAWLFYRSRAVSHSSWADSDFVVFGVPLIVGFVVFMAVLFPSAFPTLPTSKRAPAIFGLAASGALISSFIGTVIGFNLYGT